LKNVSVRNLRRFSVVASDVAAFGSNDSAGTASPASSAAWRFCAGAGQRGGNTRGVDRASMGGGFFAFCLDRVADAGHVL
jgi:hypothetical protein